MKTGTGFKNLLSLFPVGPFGTNPIGPVRQSTTCPALDNLVL